MKITAVVPCYNEQEALGLFYEELNRVTAEMLDCEFEILFVNDGSKDRTLELMKELAEKDGRVKYISFSRNFGKEAAIYAGLEHASGDLVAIMDADLQDPPRLLPELSRTIPWTSYDSVATRRVTRKGEPPIRSFFARMFYRLMNKMCKTEVVDGARDFRLMTRPFVDSLLSMKEYNRFSKGLFGWVGFRTKWIEFENVERVAGETKWSFWKLLLYAIDGMVAFSTMPLSVAALIGILMCVIAALSIIFIIVRQLCFGGSAFGWPSMVCIMIFIGGVQLLCMGIMGQYLAKTYLEVKHRPIYITRETEQDRDERKPAQQK